MSGSQPLKLIIQNVCHQKPGVSNAANLHETSIGHLLHAATRNRGQVEQDLAAWLYPDVLCLYMANHQALL